MAKLNIDPWGRPRHYKHYAIGMKANDSVITKIEYPSDTTPRWQGHVSRNCGEMVVSLDNGKVISSAELILQTEEAFNAQV